MYKSHSQILNRLKSHLAQLNANINDRMGTLTKSTPLKRTALYQFIYTYAPCWAQATNHPNE